MKSYEDGFKEGFREGFYAALQAKSIPEVQLASELEWARKMREEMFKWHPPLVITCVDQH